MTVVLESGLPPSMLGRATLILDAFDAPDRRLTLGQVALRTRLPRSTAHRILDQLIRLDWVAHTDLGYVLGRRVRSWAGADRGHGELRAAAAPVLHDLLLASGGVVHLGVLDQGDVVLLDKLGGRSASAVPTRVGGRSAAHRVALGRAALAALPPEEAERRVAALAPDADLAGVHLALHRIRRAGAARVVDEYAAGLTTVAVATGAAGAVGVVVPHERADRVVPLVREAAARVRQSLVG
ncbi:MAG: putative transcriptional regulator, IclR family [Nocardioides sp.]|nr:putative transcriptional regulator, IclR family [Nocardioides sp.]